MKFTESHLRRMVRQEQKKLKEEMNTEALIEKRKNILFPVLFAWNASNRNEFDELCETLEDLTNLNWTFEIIESIRSSGYLAVIRCPRYISDDDMRGFAGMIELQS